MKYPNIKNLRKAISQKAIIGLVKNGKYETELEQLRKERQGDSKFCVFISGEEIYERYHNKLPAFYIDDPFANYVVLVKKENKK